MFHGETRGASRCGLAVYIKKYLKAKRKNYGNSNISPCKNYNLQKNPLKETKMLQDIITLYLISSFNTNQKNHLSKILV